MAPIRTGAAFLNSKSTSQSKTLHKAFPALTPLPCVRIHHTQHSDCSSACHRIMREVQRPFLVSRCPATQWLCES
jgi:hypothetical protein